MQGTFRRTLAAAAAALAAMFVATGVLAQAPPAPTGAGRLTIRGDVTQTLSLAPAELKAMPRTAVTLTDEGGRRSAYEGVLVGELLRRAGVSLGRGMGSPLLASYVIATASDGYQAVFSFGELDTGLTANDIIVADTLDGKPLAEGQGPLRLVAPHDKRPVRAVRMLERIEVVLVKNAPR